MIKRLSVLFALLCLPLGGSCDEIDFADNAAVQKFAKEISERHKLEFDSVVATLAQAKYDARVIRLITPPEKAPSAPRSWKNYRARFFDRARIQGGLVFWRQNQNYLKRAADTYGVPAEIIVAIIGVETLYGRHTGSFETLSTLATLAFDYPPREELFRGELEQLFLLAKEQSRPIDSYYGSYAGAIGYPQFLPSSFRKYAVDFDKDGSIDFHDNPRDAIGSIGNYLKAFGWKKNAPIAERVILTEPIAIDTLTVAGIEPALSPTQLKKLGVAPVSGKSIPATATFVALETPDQTPEFWLGYNNFYVITRYNKSSFYAMAVFQLAETLRERREQQLRAAQSK